jgi:hypothetical protein
MVDCKFNALSSSIYGGAVVAITKARTNRGIHMIILVKLLYSMNHLMSIFSDLLAGQRHLLERIIILNN